MIKSESEKSLMVLASRGILKAKFLFDNFFEIGSLKDRYLQLHGLN